eukprot:TRINITY_DN64709_c0_g1_i1.p4 TRINITY_DN64709_c0_g1~~TRINITY_DN64709_c0_g1_i1.p4  ORF type:complete len:198 (+),score=52.93 TRINITY_DN64709_c0_g1_i1:1769-2362(+)
MKLLKLIEENKGVHCLDLSNNDLRDEFAAAILNALKTNTEILFIKLHGNPMDLKRIHAIDVVLEKNRELKRKKEVPNYMKEISKYTLPPNEFNKTIKVIKDIAKECEIEQKLVDVQEKALKKVKTSELTKTNAIQKKKDEVDKELKRVTKEEDEFDTKCEEEKVNNEKEVLELEGKLENTLKTIERLTVASIFNIYF